MALHIDCSTCPGRPRACEGCSVGLLLGPVVLAAPAPAPEPAATAEPGAVAPGDHRAGPGLDAAIAAFVNAGMLPGPSVRHERYDQAG